MEKIWIGKYLNVWFYDIWNVCFAFVSNVVIIFHIMLLSTVSSVIYGLLVQLCAEYLHHQDIAASFLFVPVRDSQNIVGNISVILDQEYSKTFYLQTFTVFGPRPKDIYLFPTFKRSREFLKPGFRWIQLLPVKRPDMKMLNSNFPIEIQMRGRFNKGHVDYMKTSSSPRSLKYDLSSWEQKGKLFCKI